MRDPTPEDRTAPRGRARHHGKVRREVVVGTGPHRADERDLIGDVAEMRKKLGQLHPALAVVMEFPQRPHDFPTRLRGIVELELAVERLAVALHQFRLGIEEVDLTRPAEHVHRDHRLRLRLLRRLLRQEIMDLAFQLRLLQRSALFRQQAVLL